MSKLITVFGATGNQGGSVIESILADVTLSKEFKIRGITRNISKPAAQELVKKGVELVVADMMSKQSLQKAVQNSHTVFLVTNYWETHGTTDEVTQGKNVADVCKDLGVQHLIYSSSVNVTKTSKGRLTHLPHFDGKADVEEYIRDSGIPATFFLAGYFMSNLETFTQRDEDGTLTWALPTGKDAKFPLIDIKKDTGMYHDLQKSCTNLMILTRLFTDYLTGKFVKAIIRKRVSLLGARILGAEGYYTADQILDIISKEGGKKTQLIQLDEATYKSFIPLNTAQEILETHLLNEKPGYYNGEGLEKSHEILEDKLVDFKEFVRNSKILQG
ncbi:NmrA-like family domain-containing protein 1 [Colletotrichum spaethianum]|uniref:NmrA-like family domain-containing protein 1 n=1 Tax=Colletotrichum spaethianum TaxID=700344 RepID=A0AA37LIP1_9PEZI|nr:NmrA-like family domain-containing protein 1 [Colletotrichum spaethianum]GKT44772.1 NmrA-like family domain-containing protein 1 [Colletotrichum spaethianum]